MFKYLTLLLFFTFINTNAQLETAHWYFGATAGVDFSTGTPVDDANGALVTFEGCSSISDPLGNLLFYTDGQNSYNKNHIPLLNGNNLLGNSSSSQSAIIIPRPGNVKQYYIFTVDANDNFPSRIKGLHYSLVDMTLDAGLGAVVLAEKNIPLLLNGIQRSSEKVTAVKHGNKIDYWVITHFLDNFYAFLVTSTGVVTSPVVSKIGPNISEIGYPTNARGCVKASPNGKNIAIAHLSNISSYPSNIQFDPTIDTNHNNGYAYGTAGYLGLYNFDDTTGIVSNEVAVNTKGSFYGVEFSTNSKYLYASENYFDQSKLPLNGNIFELVFQKGTLAQYDVDTGSDIANSRVELTNQYPFDLYSSDEGARGSLQLGLDGKVYHSLMNRKALQVINAPNIHGIGANFVLNGFPLTNYTLLGLPPFVSSFFNNTIIVNNIGSCLNSNINFSINTDITNYTLMWHFGDGTSSTTISPSHSYTKLGTYIVTAQLTKGNFKTTITSEIIIGTAKITGVEKNNTTVRILATGNPTPLEYSLDGGAWQKSNTFYNLSNDLHDALVRNANQCVSTQYSFETLNIANMFSPNGDGVNDQWQVLLPLYPKAKIEVYDRYGKKLSDGKINDGFYWDGTYLGHPVPSTDYWYILKLTESKILTGHITIRNY